MSREQTYGFKPLLKMFVVALLNVLLYHLRDLVSEMGDPPRFLASLNQYEVLWCPLTKVHLFLFLLIFHSLYVHRYQNRRKV